VPSNDMNTCREDAYLSLGIDYASFLGLELHIYLLEN
jgi:hypothetical protein